MIHVIRKRATPQQLQEMLEELKTYVKLAIDVRQGIVAGGGGLHVDCQAVLLEEGSDQRDIWGADWDPTAHVVRFRSFINIRPKQQNRSQEIENLELRQTIEAIVRERFR